MFVGSLGHILIIVGTLRYLEAVGGSGYLLSFMGFILTMIYINYLEAKADISKKIIWVKSILSILTLLVIYIYYSNFKFIQLKGALVKQSNLYKQNARIK